MRESNYVSDYEDEFPDVTDEREPAIASYATDGPYDYGNPLEDV